VEKRGFNGSEKSENIGVTWRFIPPSDIIMISDVKATFRQNYKLRTSFPN
jgi:hypothetical protein